MGWIHSIDKGYGIYLNKLSMKEIFNNCENLNLKLNTAAIRKIYPELNIKMGKFSYKEKVLLLGMGKYNPYSWYDYNIHSVNDITPEYIRTDVINDDYWFDIVVCDSISLLFCLKYNYPYDAFKSLTDYNNDTMLFCNATFPIKKGHESLINLTEETYIKQLNEFFGLLVSKWKHIDKLDLCEEFVKE